MSRLRIVRITCGLAAALLALAAVGAHAADQPAAAALPSNFGGVASVSGLYEHLDSNPALSAVSEPVFASFGDGHSTYAPDTLVAVAAPYYPGDTINGLPGLLCTAGLPPACNAPPLPIVASANAQTPDATVSIVPAVVPGGTVPLSLGPLTGEAHVNPATGVSTTALVGELDEAASTFQRADAIRSLRSTLAAIVGHPVGAGSSSALLHIGAISGVTTQAFRNGALHVHAEAHDTGISLVGGVVQIGSASAVSDTTADGVSPPKHSDSGSLSGVTVAGLPATIDEHGITITGANVPASVVSAATGALAQALSALGVTVQFLGHSTPSVLQASSCTKGEADGLQVHAAQDLRAVPVEGAIFFDNIAIGAACTTANVVADASTVGGPSTTGAPDFSGGTSPGAAPGSSDNSAAGSSVPSSSGTGPGAAPTSAALGPIPQSSTPRTVLPFLEADLRIHAATFRIEALYLAFALTAFAFLLGSPYLFRRRKGVANA